MQNKNLTVFAKKLAELLNQKDKLKEQLKKLQEKIDTLQPKYLELMEEENVTNYKVKNIGTVYISSDIYAKIIDKEALFKFLKDNDAQSLLTVNSNSLKSYAKELIENKNEQPDGVEISTKMQVRIRGRKKGD